MIKLTSRYERENNDDIQWMNRVEEQQLTDNNKNLASHAGGDHVGDDKEARNES